MRRWRDPRFDRRADEDFEYERALLRVKVALLDLRLHLKANPWWRLQPRAPAGQEDGGRWLPSGPVAPRGALPVLPGAAAIAALREAAKRAAPYLRRLPKYWEGLWPGDEAFDDETGRIAEPSVRRPEHPLVRFRSESELRRYLRPAGAGREWHHIVEKRLAGDRFPAEMIHSTDNIVSLPVELHRRVSAHMSRKTKQSGVLTVRDWIKSRSFADQYRFGLDLIEELDRSVRNVGP
jgi:hypothetical protein